jgi:hypothetical protein
MLLLNHAAAFCMVGIIKNSLLGEIESFEVFATMAVASID